MVLSFWKAILQNESATIKILIFSDLVIPLWSQSSEENSIEKKTIYTNMFFKDFIYLFLERRREGIREGEKHHCVVASCAPPTGGLACNPGMCPDWESNQGPFGLQASAQSTGLHQPGQYFYKNKTTENI